MFAGVLLQGVEERRITRPLTADRIRIIDAYVYSLDLDSFGFSHVTPPA